MSGKKIALCISGEPRHSMACFPYLFESFIVAHPQYEIDVYIHSFKAFRAIPLYNPKKVLLEEVDEFDIYKHYLDKFEHDIIGSHSTPFRNTILMHYGVNKCFNLTKNIKYDYYIRCRPDIKLNSFFDLSYVINNLESNKKDLWVPHNYDAFDWENSINDQLAIGNYNAIKIYSELINHLGKVVSQTNSYYPEGLLGTYLNNSPIKIEKGYIDMALVRNVKFITNPKKLNFYEY